jgi:ATP-dependent DNA helicase PIF1
MECPDSVLDYFSQHCPPGIAPHALTMKTNAVYRLLRNFSIDRGLVKNARVIPINLGACLIMVRIIQNTVDAHAIETEDVLIPRITFETTLPSGHTLLRCQFPLAPAYATTFNSCQGMTLDRIGIDLTRPVFSHGQLYTALSRICNHEHAVARLRPGETTVPNVTFDEILL